MLSQTQLLTVLGFVCLIDVSFRFLFYKSNYKVKKKVYSALACFNAVSIFILISLYVPSAFGIGMAAIAALFFGFFLWVGFVHCPSCGATMTKADVKKKPQCIKCQTDLMIS